MFSLSGLFEVGARAIELEQCSGIECVKSVAVVFREFLRHYTKQ